MKSLQLLSWNVRGTCNLGTKRMIRDSLITHKINFVCIQETTCGKWDKRMVNSLWDADLHYWVDNESVGLAGGLLTSWDNSVFSLLNSEINERWIWSHVATKEDKKDFHIINIYSAQDLCSKRRLWNELTQIYSVAKNSPCCFIGDFNCIRSNAERINCSFRRADMEEFNVFIKSTLHHIWFLPTLENDVATKNVALDV